MLKQFNKKRLIILLVSLSLALVMGVGVTVALIMAQTAPIENVFEPSFVDCAVLSDTSIDNTGDTEAYIRAAIIVTWKKDGVVWAQKPVLDTDYSLQIGSNWIKSGEYYYFTEPVAYDQATEKLISSYGLLPGATPPAGYELSVEIVAAAIQSTPTTAVQGTWGVIVTDGKITG